MVDDQVDRAILSVAIVGGLLGVALLAEGQLVALGPLVVAAMGFAYAKGDLQQFLDRSGGEGDGTAERDPLDALRDRYARGEIDEAEFERRLDDLLKTETVADAADYRRSSRAERSRERERKLERER